MPIRTDSQGQPLSLASMSNGTFGETTNPRGLLGEPEAFLLVPDEVAHVAFISVSLFSPVSEEFNES